MALRRILLAASLAATGVAAPMTPLLTTRPAAAAGIAPGEGMEVRARRPVPLRSSPPKDGLFYAGKGRALGEIQAGEVFQVNQVALVRKPLGDEVWLYLTRMGGMGGWAYSGPAGRVSRNFRNVETE